MSTLGFIGNLSMGEVAVIAIIAVLLFGRRLPEVGRSIGKGIVEFKRGLAGVDDIVASGTALVEARPIAGPTSPPSTHASRTAALRAATNTAAAPPTTNDRDAEPSASAGDRADERPAADTGAKAGATSTV